MRRAATNDPGNGAFSFIPPYRMRARSCTRRYTCGMSNSRSTRLEAALAAVPEALRPSVAMLAQELAPALDGLPAGDWMDALPRVFTGSEFVAHACVSRSDLLPDLVRSGDLLRLYGADEMRARVLAGVTLFPGEVGRKAPIAQPGSSYWAWASSAARNSTFPPTSISSLPTPRKARPTSVV